MSNQVLKNIIQMSFRDESLAKFMTICSILLLLSIRVNGALDLLTALGSDGVQQGLNYHEVKNYVVAMQPGSNDLIVGGLSQFGNNPQTTESFLMYINGTTNDIVWKIAFPYLNLGILGVMFSESFVVVLGYTNMYSGGEMIIQIRQASQFNISQRSDYVYAYQSINIPNGAPTFDSVVQNGIYSRSFSEELYVAVTQSNIRLYTTNFFNHRFVTSQNPESSSKYNFASYLLQKNPSDYTKDVLYVLSQDRQGPLTIIKLSQYSLGFLDFVQTGQYTLQTTLINLQGRLTVDSGGNPFMCIHQNVGTRVQLLWSDLTTSSTTKSFKSIYISQSSSCVSIRTLSSSQAQFLLYSQQNSNFALVTFDFSTSSMPSTQSTISTVMKIKLQSGVQDVLTAFTISSTNTLILAGISIGLESPKSPNPTNQVGFISKSKISTQWTSKAYTQPTTSSTLTSVSQTQIQTNSNNELMDDTQGITYMQAPQFFVTTNGLPQFSDTFQGPAVLLNKVPYLTNQNTYSPYLLSYANSIYYSWNPQLMIKQVVHMGGLHPVTGYSKDSLYLQDDENNLPINYTINLVTPQDLNISYFLDQKSPNEYGLRVFFPTGYLNATYPQGQTFIFSVLLSDTMGVTTQKFLIGADYSNSGPANGPGGQSSPGAQKTGGKFIQPVKTQTKPQNNQTMQKSYTNFVSPLGIQFTKEDYEKGYGYVLVDTSSTVSLADGSLKVQFTRPVYWPPSLVQGFMPKYSFKDPMAAIREDYIKQAKDSSQSQDNNLDQGNDQNSTSNQTQASNQKQINCQGSQQGSRIRGLQKGQNGPGQQSPAGGGQSQQTPQGNPSQQSPNGAPGQQSRPGESGQSDPCQTGQNQGGQPGAGQGQNQGGPGGNGQGQNQGGPGGNGQGQNQGGPGGNGQGQNQGGPGQGGQEGGPNQNGPDQSQGGPQNENKNQNSGPAPNSQGGQQPNKQNQNTQQSGGGQPPPPNRMLQQEIALKNLTKIQIVDSKTKKLQNDIVFSYDVIGADLKSITFNFTFKQPEQISINGKKSLAAIQLMFSSFEPLWDDNQIFYQTLVKQNIPKTEAGQAIGSVGNAMQAATAASTALSLLMTTALSQLWGMINGLQLVVHLPIMQQITDSFPDTPKWLIQEVIKIATFSLIDTQKYFFDPVMTVPEENEDYYLVSVQNLQYGSTYTCLNLGTLFFFIVGFIFEAILLITFKSWIKNYKFGQRILGKLWRPLFWNTFIRVFLESCLEIAVSVLNNYQMEMAMYRAGISTFYQPQLLFFWINLFTMIGSFLFVIVFVPFMLLFYLRKHELWKEEEFEEKYGSFLESLIPERKSALFYPIFFIVRRVVIAWQGVYMGEYFLVQIHTLYGMTLLSLFYLISFRPFEDDLMQNLELLNEVTYLLTSYTVFMFNEQWVVSAEIRNEVGYVFTAILTICILVHLFFLFKTILIELMQKLKIKYVQCKKRIGVKSKQVIPKIAKPGDKVEDQDTKLQSANELNKTIVQVEDNESQKIVQAIQWKGVVDFIVEERKQEDDTENQLSQAQSRRQFQSQQTDIDFIVNGYRTNFGNENHRNNPFLKAFEKIQFIEEVDQQRKYPDLIDPNMSFSRQQKLEPQVERSLEQSDDEYECESYYEQSEDWNDEIQFQENQENLEDSQPATVRTPPNKSERNFVIEKSYCNY